MRPAVLDSTLEGASDRERFAEAKRAGFAGIEISLERSELRTSDWKPLESLRCARDDVGIEVAAVGLPEHNRGGVGGEDHKIAGPAMADIRQAIFWAVELHAGAVRIPFYDAGELVDDAEIGRAAKALRELCPLAHEHGVLLLCDAPLPADQLWRLAAGVNPRLHFNGAPERSPTRPRRLPFNFIPGAASGREKIDAWIASGLDADQLHYRLLGLMREQRLELCTRIVRAVADEKRLEQQIAGAQAKVAQWQKRAEDAVLRDEDDLAREAIRRRIECQTNIKDWERQWNGQKLERDWLEKQLDALNQRYQRAEIAWQRFWGGRGKAADWLMGWRSSSYSPDEPISIEWLDNLYHIEEMLEAGTLKDTGYGPVRPADAGFGCCADLDAMAARGLDLSAELRSLGDLIQQIRIRDSRPCSNTHLAGETPTPFPEGSLALGKIGYEGWMIVTTRPGQPKSVARGLS